MVAAALVALLFVVAASSEAFQTQLTTLSKAARFRSVDATGCLHRSTGWSRLAAATESVDGDIDTFLSENYPDTKGLIDSNDEVAKKLREVSESGYTIFAPTTTSFKNLGDKKISQLDDPRNLEVREKIAAYHAIAEPVTAVVKFRRFWSAEAYLDSWGEAAIKETARARLRLMERNSFARLRSATALFMRLMPWYRPRFYGAMQIS